MAEVAKKVMKKLREEVEKKLRRKASNFLVTENGEEGKSKIIASCGFLQNELRQFGREEGVTLADSVETLGVYLKTRVKRLEEKEKAKRNKCKVKFSFIKKKHISKKKKKIHESGVNKLLRAGMMPARAWRIHTVGMAPTEKRKLRRQLAAAAGNKSTTFLSLFMEAYGLEVEEGTFHLGHSVLGRRSLDWKMAS